MKDSVIRWECLGRYEYNRGHALALTQLTDLQTVKIVPVVGTHEVYVWVGMEHTTDPVPPQGCRACLRQTDPKWAALPVTGDLCYCVDCRKCITSGSYAHSCNGRTQCDDCKKKTRVDHPLSGQQPPPGGGRGAEPPQPQSAAQDDLEITLLAVRRLVEEKVRTGYNPKRIGITVTFGSATISGQQANFSIGKRSYET